MKLQLIFTKHLSVLAAHPWMAENLWANFWGSRCHSQHQFHSLWLQSALLGCTLRQPSFTASLVLDLISAFGPRGLGQESQSYSLCLADSYQWESESGHEATLAVLSGREGREDVFTHLCCAFGEMQGMAKSFSDIHFFLIAFAAAAAKSLQLCLTLCNPTDGSPPGSSVPGILQARILEWVAISFSNAWSWK